MTLTLTEIVARSLEEPTLVDALAFAAVCECERAMDQKARNQVAGTRNGGLGRTDTVAAFKVGDRVRMTDRAWAETASYRDTLSREGEVVEIGRRGFTAGLGEINVRHDFGVADLEDGRREWRWRAFQLELA